LTAGECDCAHTVTAGVHASARVAAAKKIPVCIKVLLSSRVRGATRYFETESHLPIAAKDAATANVKRKTYAMAAWQMPIPAPDRINASCARLLSVLIAKDSRRHALIMSDTVSRNFAGSLPDYFNLYIMLRLRQQSPHPLETWAA
jgi:hypothetical protein